MITELDNESDNCKVLLITPINENLIPCQKYNCNLNCNHSHGIEINKGLILSYDILDIKTLKEKGICFAKYEDSVWYLAKIIRRIENENTKHVDKFIIKYKGYDEYEEITPENIIPVCGMDIESILDEWSDSENNYSSDSDITSYSSDSNSFEEFNYESLSNSTSITDDSLKFLGNNSSFGEWEKHTKGIASQLMKKMGYEHGKGLGINGEGIINPIQIEIRPPGKGLDFEIDEIEELTIKRQKEQEKRKLILMKKKQRKRKLNSMESIDSDVFDFLNVSINKKAKGKLYAIETKSKLEEINNGKDKNKDEIKSTSLKRKKQEIASKKSKKENNMKLLQIQKQINDLNYQIKRAYERYDRNKVRDKVVAEHYKSKIEEFKKILNTLELKEKQVKNSINDSKTMYSKFEF
ncbi:G-patch-domain-containing protein [Anaeromyces robustus]|uniref:G-patch-domain-containing protein n=1 Tax=Anaeromyces robustus TaxID=1754192 RepID=A0A1Y1XN04_9FUNG|nr:G-patch-domain-containing protein [Anaeromyces robustus]|eukprot:ORX87140.1 G-patch-domain-containing protein [Anaeromyces robustus]